MRGTTSNENLAPGANFPTVFNYGSSKLRTIKKNEETWFCAKDVCDSLSIKQVVNAIDTLDEDEKALLLIVTPHINAYKSWFINESGLYHLIFISRKPEAKAFRKWVTSEVLPALRTQGSYEVQRADVESNHLATSIHNQVNAQKLVAVYQDVARIHNNRLRMSLLNKIKNLS